MVLICQSGYMPNIEFFLIIYPSYFNYVMVLIYILYVGVMIILSIFLMFSNILLTIKLEYQVNLHLNKVPYKLQKISQGFGVEVNQRSWKLSLIEQSLVTWFDCSFFSQCQQSNYLFLDLILYIGPSFQSIFVSHWYFIFMSCGGPLLFQMEAP